MPRSDGALHLTVDELWQYLNEIADTYERSRPLPMTINYAPYYDDLHYARRQAAQMIQVEGTSIAVTTGLDPDWRETATRAFHFLRANADRRYSANALMKVMAAAEQTFSDEPHIHRALPPSPPVIIEVGSDFTYDPDTEVKSGGTLGVLVQLNDDYNRALLAIAPAARRKGIGSALLRVHEAFGPASLFVHRGNVTAQMFLLNRAYLPQVINQQGAIRFAQYECHDEEV